MLKGTQIANALDVHRLPLEQWGAALIFIVAGVIVVQIAKRLAGRRAQARSGAPSASSALYLFLSFNLLAYLFENLKEVVNKLIGYTERGLEVRLRRRSAMRPIRTIGFIFATQVLPTIIFIASIFAILYYLGVMQVVVTLLRQDHVALHGRVGRGVDFGGGVDLHGTDRGAADDPAVPAGA